MKQKKQKNTEKKFYKKSEKTQKNRRTMGSLFREKRAEARKPRETTVEGIFLGTRHGYGFLRVEGRSDEIFIPASKTNGAYHGDTVRVSFSTRYGGEKTEGRVLSVLSYGTETVTGILQSRVFRLHRKNFRECFVLPDDARFGEAIEVAECDTPDGNKVEVFLAREGRGTSVVIRDFGNAESRGANYEAILAAHKVRTVFPDACLSEAKRVASEPLPEGRYRPKEFIMTIDGADAKDLDDAVSVSQKKDGTWRLGVHIADVSHYVRRGGEVEHEAFLRGTSIYFTDKVVPMLPKTLSNGACSLNAGEDKLAVSAYMTLDGDGNILATELRESVIRSSLRGVYEEVNDVFDKKRTSAYYEKYAPALPSLKKMLTLYRILAKKAAARGGIDFDSADAEILVDENGDPVDILRRERGVAERMIEQFMLTANEGVATLLYTKKLPCVYRLHETPDPMKVREFSTFAAALGLDTSGLSPEKASPFAFRKILDEAKEKGIADGVSYALLRTMQKAVYSADKHGHYGLFIPLYCHFTSPIRRLSDLATHRLIRECLFRGKNAAGGNCFAHRAAEAATDGEYRALAAERAIADLYKALYMQKFIGQEFDATVSSVTSFGVFAALDNTCEGLISMASLDGHYAFDEERRILVGPSGIFRLGDKIRIRVAETDVTKSKVYFTFLAKIDKNS